MSNSPLPVHLSCYGVSSDAVNIARYSENKALHQPSYNQKLDSVKNHLDTKLFQVNGRLKAQANAFNHPLAQSQDAAQPFTSQAAPASQLQRRSMPALSPTEVAKSSLPYAQYQSIVALSEASIPQPRTKLVCTSISFDNSKLQLPPQPNTSHIDFVAIADSSTGGNGLPRPYGRFCAGRHGDGTAVWERVPPDRTMEWHAKLFGNLAAHGVAFNSVKSPTAPAGPGGLTGAGVAHHPKEGGKEPHSPISPRSSMQRDTGSHRMSPERNALRSSSSQLSASLGGTGAASNRSQASRGTGSLTPLSAAAAESFYRRAETQPLGSSRPPLQPESRYPGYQLPSATFLTEVPPLPGVVRVDCGYSTAKEFLKSGLHEKRPPPHLQLQGPGSPAGAEEAVQGDGETEGEWTAEEQQGSPPLSPGAAGASSPKPQVPGYKRLHEGVYVPIDPQEEAVINRTIAVAKEVPQSTQLLAALYDEQHPLARRALSEDVMHRVRRLPDERTLPRRFVPWVGR